MKTNRQKGFTLAEMLVVISIIGIGAAMSFTLAAGFIRGNKISQATRMVQAALLEARSRALAAKLNTSVVLYRQDNLVVITNEKWEPLGQPVLMPEPCYFYVDDGSAYISAGWWWNRVAPKYYIMTVTFDETGAALRNLPAAYGSVNPRCGAIFITIVDPTLGYGCRGGSVQVDDGETLEISAGLGAFAFGGGGRGYCMIGGELVSYTGAGWTATWGTKMTGVQRNIFGTAKPGALKGKTVWPAGYCGNIMVIGSTGQVVTLLF